jgi:hypothetical protein
MLYSKNGSIPKPETDGTEDWIEVPDEPIAPEGQEVIWCPPTGWVVRDVMPTVRDGYRWAYYLDRGWVEQAIETEQVVVVETEQIASIETSQISGLNG